MISAQSAQRIRTLADDRPVLTVAGEGPKQTEAWDRIDSELMEWLGDPNGLVEPGGAPPSRWVVRLARQWVVKLREKTNWSAPVMVVPDNAGGLAFEFHSGGIFRMFSIHKDGRSNLSVFRNGQFISATPLDL